MNPGKIAGANRGMVKPKNWDETLHGDCATLPVLDTGIWMQSAWFPSPDEMRLMAAGHPVILQVSSRQHPVVSLGVATSTNAAEMMCEHGGTISEGCPVCEAADQRATAGVIVPVDFGKKKPQ